MVLIFTHQKYKNDLEFAAVLATRRSKVVRSYNDVKASIAYLRLESPSFADRRKQNKDQQKAICGFKVIDQRRVWEKGVKKRACR